MAEASSDQSKPNNDSDPSDIRRLSRSGTSFYELLELPKEASLQDIKRKYRRLALQFHPDKNPGDAEAEDKFKRINHVHRILTDEKKRRIYDKYGSFGLRVADQFGDDAVEHIMFFSSKPFICLMSVCGLLTGCCFCFCCFCCCCFCCGKCGRTNPEDEEDVPDIVNLEAEAEDDPTNAGPIISQPQPSTSKSSSDIPMAELAAASASSQPPNGHSGY